MRRKRREYKKIAVVEDVVDSLPRSFFKREEEDRQGKEEERMRERKRNTAWSLGKWQHCSSFC